MNKRNVAIIGCGYIGQQVAEVFTTKGWVVHKIVRTPEDDMIAADVSDLSSMQKLAESIHPAPPTHIVLAASSGRGGVEAYRKVFVDGVTNIHQVFPDAHLIFTSSTSVYAQQNGEVVDELSAALPDRETGKMLLEAERIVLEKQGTVLRLSGIYGPGRSVILKKFLKGEATIEEDGRRILNQIHRDDAATAYYHIANAETSKGEIYNVTDDVPTSQGDVMKALAAKFSRTVPESALRDLNRKRGWTHKAVSNKKIKALHSSGGIKSWVPSFSSFMDAVDEIAPTLNLET